MEALSLSGIPVVADRGKSGGWRLIDQFRSIISGMKLDELRSLFVLPSELVLEQLGIPSGGRVLRDKLTAVMPHTVKDSAQQYMEKIYIDTESWKQTPMEPGVLERIQEALWDDRKLRILYQKADGNASERLVGPLGLVLQGTVWYLVAMNEDDEYRSFRVSRIRELESQTEPFARPDNFQLAAYWKQSKRQFKESLPKVHVQVLFHPSIRGRLSFTNKFVQSIDTAVSPTDDQMMSAQLSFNTEQEAVEYVLGFGGNMRLVQPEHLVEQIMEQARKVLEMYTEKMEN